MIELNLYSITKHDPDAMVGRCIARSRFDKEGMGVGILDFAKGFLKEHLSEFSPALSNTDLEKLIQDSDTILTTKDMASLNYYLNTAGYKLQIQNVTDDEENPSGITDGHVVEWNVIDTNFLQYDYPTATKIIPADGMELPQILRQIVENSSLFDKSKFPESTKNPLKSLLDALDNNKKVTGAISSSITSKIYSILGQCGIKIFCAMAEK